MKPTWFFFAALVLAVPFGLWADAADTSADESLRLTPESNALLQRDAGLLKLEPVLLPDGPHLLGPNDHFGWPVATVTGKTIVVVFYRAPQHWKGKDEPDADTSTAVTIRSRDGGKTWSEPVDLKRFVETPVKGCRLGFGNTIGTDADGAVVVVTSYGVFRSEDEETLRISTPIPHGAMPTARHTFLPNSGCVGRRTAGGRGRRRSPTSAPPTCGISVAAPITARGRKTRWISASTP